MQIKMDKKTLKLMLAGLGLLLLLCGIYVAVNVSRQDKNKIEETTQTAQNATEQAGETDAGDMQSSEETVEAEKEQAAETDENAEEGAYKKGDWRYMAAAGLDGYFANKEGLAEQIEDNLNKIISGEIDASQLLPEDEEYSNFAIAKVDHYVNVRSEPTTDSEVVAKMYDGAVAQVQKIVECEDGEWLQVISGNAEGYIKAQYFIYGKDAAEVIDDYVDRYAVVECSRLNIRKEPDIESDRVGYALNGEKLKVIGQNEDGDWIKVDYGNSDVGFVSAEFVTVKEEYIYAKTLEEERAQLEENEALLARQKESEETAPEDVEMAETQTAPESTATYTASGNTRSDLVNFALQYVGHPYVHGGNSLENGTDCSGFTSLVYAQFGYSLSRTPSGQLSGNGRSVSMDDIQPGDIVCYGKSSCTHVAIYIGNGQIVHAANPSKGIVTQRVDYDNILGIKSVID